MNPAVDPFLCDLWLAGIHTNTNVNTTNFTISKKREKIPKIQKSSVLRTLTEHILGNSLKNWSNFTVCRPNFTLTIDIRPTYHNFHQKFGGNEGKVAENYHNTPARSFYVITKALFELN